MLIKQQGFDILLPANRPFIFVLMGEEPYLNTQFQQIAKQKWLHTIPTENIDKQHIDVMQASDWQQLLSITDNYSLWSSFKQLQIHYGKKTLDKEGKLFLKNYLEKKDEDCFIILTLPQVNLKEITFISEHPQAIVLVLKTPSPPNIETWLKKELQKKGFQYEASVPQLLTSYSQGNLLACAQLVELLALTYETQEYLTENIIYQHLIDQSQFNLFELNDACLIGNFNQALRILRQPEYNRPETILMLWTLSQELRILIQLQDLQTMQKVSLDTAMNQLRIWSNRKSLYQKAIQRLNKPLLHELLKICSQLDQALKTTQHIPVTYNLELLVLSFCTGQLRNSSCIPPI